MSEQGTDVPMQEGGLAFHLAAEYGALCLEAVRSGWSLMVTRPAMGGRTMVKVRATRHGGRVYCLTVMGPDSLSDLRLRLARETFGEQMRGVVELCYPEEAKRGGSW